MNDIVGFGGQPWGQGGKEFAFFKTGVFAQDVGQFGLPVGVLPLWLMEQLAQGLVVVFEALL